MVNIAANIAAAKHELRRSDLFNLFQYGGTSSIVVLLALRVMVLILFNKNYRQTDKFSWNY
jgi:hypothetical protein